MKLSSLCSLAVAQALAALVGVTVTVTIGGGDSVRAFRVLQRPRRAAIGFPCRSVSLSDWSSKQRRAQPSSLPSTSGRNIDGGTAAAAAAGPKAGGRRSSSSNSIRNSNSNSSGRSGPRQRQRQRGEAPASDSASVVALPIADLDLDGEDDAKCNDIYNDNANDNANTSGGGGGAAAGPKAAGRRSSSSSRRRSSATDRRTSTIDSDSGPPSVVAADGDGNSGGGGPRAGSSRRRSQRQASSASGPVAAGPRSRSTGPRSPRPDRSARRRRAEAQMDGPSPQPQPARQAHLQPPKQKAQEPFDGRVFTARQTSNPEAPRLDLRAALSSSSPSSPPSSVFNCVTPGLKCFEEADRQDLQRPNTPFEYRSLDDLLASALQHQGIVVPPRSESENNNHKNSKGFFSLSEKFNSDEAFRNNLRSAIRSDVFDTTPFYAKLPEKAKSILLLPDSSLEGSWRIPDEAEITEAEGKVENENNDKEEHKHKHNDKTHLSVRRMKHTTRILNQALREHYDEIEDDVEIENEDNNQNQNQNTIKNFRFTGDDLFRAIGAICGDGASTHWIDIYGVQDRKINHSWHLDAGRSPQNCKTVLWGFPPENHYSGTGVFSHIVSLEDPFGSTLDIVDDDKERERPRMEPVLFEGGLGEDFVFRPAYEAGKELLIYRDIDVLHSAPDVAYRTSVMRFM